MTRLVLIGAVVVVFAGLALPARPARADSPLGVSVIPPLKLPPSSDARITGISVNLIYGHSKSVRGIEVGAINRARERFAGFQLGGINVQDGKRGSSACVLCLGMIGNFHRKVSGIQAGLLLNVAIEAGGVMQMGLLNHVETDASFVFQVGFMNTNNVLPAPEGEPATWHSGKQKGFQLSAGNIADNFSGIQVGAVVNAVRNEFTGLQVSPFVNVATVMHGVQIAAFNVAEDVHGIQLGLFNITRKLHGVQIGALNIAWKNSLPAMVLVNAGF